ncbi:FtsX-like permease family protein [Streptococcus parasanguinis]|uniref:Efflux ABC transporter, permease protein n=1 Tax=Streptococcus parasanguinis (strain ATCC 15912 / DSM 6778 / CIP 104372 / LMG 14537) TaxID=760570 RepID=F8DJ44_STREP|nr:ABC transporter permease [Streptococcus parasanguinis]AEH55945.1 efflux ABC transporter, permease protein [Streptococcus parasanguinis ATCC 15912]SUN87204.1 ABC transporter membrane protein [Streptococcus parasanguinis]
MKRKVYWKDLFASFTHSKGRFLSILTLMLLGSLALVGLKVTTPNMHRTANQFIQQQKMLDLAVMGDLGLDQVDQEEFLRVKGARVEFGSLLDLTVKGTGEAIRLFSAPKSLSSFRVTKGRLPKKEGELALASFWEDRYQIGDTLTLEEKSGTSSSLKRNQFTIVGFVQSSEMWSQKNLGTAMSGSGNLDAYALVSKEVFTTKLPAMARIQFDDLKSLDSFSQVYQKRLEAHQEELEKLLKDNGKARYQRLKQEADGQIQKGQKELSRAKETLQSAKNQIDQAQKQLDLQEAQFKKLASFLPAKEQVASQEKLHQAKEQLDQKKKDWATGESELGKKEEEMKKAQRERDQLEIPTYHVYDRKTMPGGQGYLMYSNASSSISAVGNIFPVVLYLVAAMVTFTTMTRFVDEERTNAGIFKALGYRTRDIILKFVLYGFFAGTIGTLLGTLLGHYFLSGIISNIITQGMVIGESREYFYGDMTLIALGLSFIASVLPAYWVSRKELKEEANLLLLPKPPVSGSKIFLERLHFIWKRLSFTHKVTARNLFRYKQRMLMTIFGVAGSVALLFAGLGIQSSVRGVSKRQFQEILSYELIVAQKTNSSSQESKELTNRLEKSDIKDYRPIYSKVIEASLKGGRDKQTITMMVTDRTDFAPFVSLRSIKQGESLSLKKGVIISSKLAQLARVTVGDRLTLDGHSFKVAGITENYVGHFVYMDQASYQKIYGKRTSANSYLVQLRNPSTRKVQTVSRDMMALAAVKAVSQNASMISLFNSVAKSLDTTMMILVVVSILLAIVILYNLTNINVAERIRELSTIKVLGFHNKEVTLYIYRETILLSIIGILMGLGGGYYLHQFLIAMIAPDAILFYPKVGLGVFLFPVGGMILLLILLGIYVDHYLRKIDMLEALKSVD